MTIPASAAAQAYSPPAAQSARRPKGTAGHATTPQQAGFGDLLKEAMDVGHRDRANADETALAAGRGKADMIDVVPRSPKPSWRSKPWSACATA